MEIVNRTQDPQDIHTPASFTSDREEISKLGSPSASSIRSLDNTLKNHEPKENIIIDKHPNNSDSSKSTEIRATVQSLPPLISLHKQKKS
ncbi:hypothetical protein WA026_001331 [Henosepilachna vigintioctopunctata]|uniref:Uncharacterized protein n=1 Tax=Henosepilachna vigintioctopunctata TaxID=420089 RepID=A0AAW1UHM2_9CUCU